MSETATSAPESAESAKPVTAAELRMAARRKKLLEAGPDRMARLLGQVQKEAEAEPEAKPAEAVVEQKARAEMTPEERLAARRRKIMASSEDRMKKVLGEIPSASSRVEPLRHEHDGSASEPAVAAAPAPADSPAQSAPQPSDASQLQPQTSQGSDTNAGAGSDQQQPSASAPAVASGGSSDASPPIDTTTPHTEPAALPEKPAAKPAATAPAFALPSPAALVRSARQKWVAADDAQKRRVYSSALSVVFGLAIGLGWLNSLKPIADGLFSGAAGVPVAILLFFTLQFAVRSAWFALERSKQPAAPAVTRTPSRSADASSTGSDGGDADSSSGSDQQQQTAAGVPQELDLLRYLALAQRAAGAMGAVRVVLDDLCAFVFAAVLAAALTA